jgi:membrane-associated phospholipid phosphatase
VGVNKRPPIDSILYYRVIEHLHGGDDPNFFKNMNRNRIPDWLVKCIWLVVLLLLFLAYFPLNSLREPIHSLELPVDNRISLVPAFVFPYLSLYLLLVISLWRFAQAKARIFVITTLAISLDLVISYLVFLFYQTQVERPVILGSDIPSSILRWVYSIDKPFNAFPSLHTSLSTLLALLWGRVGSRIQPIIALWAVFIIASTLLTKQHYIADVFGGIAVALVSYYGAVRLGSFAVGGANERLVFWRRRHR